MYKLSDFQTCEFSEIFSVKYNNFSSVEVHNIYFSLPLYSINIYFSLPLYSTLYFSDHSPGTSSNGAALFAMSGDGTDDVYIPLVFLFHTEGEQLLEMWANNPDLEVILAHKVEVIGEFVKLKYFVTESFKAICYIS